MSGLAFTGDNPIAQAMLDDIAKGNAVPASDPSPASEEPTPIRRARRQRSDAGVPRGSTAPKNVGIPDGVAELPTRGRRRTAKVEPPKKEDIADVITMAHTMAAVMVSQKAAISEGDANRIAEKMIPVMEDFGVILVGKVIHLIGLFAAIVTVEGPIVWEVMKDVQAKSQQARAARQTQTIGATAPANPATAPSGSTADAIASMTGLEIGRPNIVE